MDGNKLLLVVKRLTKLIKEFQNLKEITAEELVDQKYKVELTTLERELYNHFLFLMKHKEFFDRLVENFLNCYQLCLNADLTTVLLYVIVFMLDEDNWKEIAKMFIHLQFKYSLSVLEYFLFDDNVVDTTQTACKIYGNDYVLENVVNPLLKNASLIEKILYRVKQDIQSRIIIPSKTPTIPITPKCISRTRQTPAAPANSFAEIAPFKPPSKIIRKRDDTVNKYLDKAYKENREKAEQLLQFARANAFNCAKTPKKVVEEKVSPPFVIKFQKPPPKKNVVIKSTTSSLMREAALVVKKKENEIQKIDALIQGAFDPTALENLDKEVRQYKEQHNLQEIERKHLQGLLTYEEAKLAKQNVVQENKLKMEEFKKEREHILEEIEAWKEQEQDKIKLLVEKCQNIEKAAREAEEKMFQNKRMQAKMVENETKDILREAYETKKRDLAEKVRLIQELRELEQVRILQIKEFDPTETPNFGLLCEMSIAELQERLGLLKVHLREELEKKRYFILDNKKKQQQMIEDMKMLVQNNKGVKIKSSTKIACKLQLTPEIIALRERLETLRLSQRVNEIQDDNFSGA